jgi:hypothetical protein
MPESYSRSTSAMSSRRTSFSSDAGSRDSRYGPFASPFDDSRAPSRAGSDDDNINTQTVSEKYNIMPSAGLLLFPEDIEKDDWLHNPDPNDKDREKCDIFTKRGILNVGGLAFITIGILVLFIGYPVLYETPPSWSVFEANSQKNIYTKDTNRQILLKQSRLFVRQVAFAQKSKNWTYRS